MPHFPIPLPRDARVFTVQCRNCFITPKSYPTEGWGNVTNGGGVSWESVLSILWSGVVKPVLDWTSRQVMSCPSPNRLQAAYRTFFGVQPALSRSLLSMQLVIMAPGPGNLGNYPILLSRHSSLLLALFSRHTNPILAEISAFLLSVSHPRARTVNPFPGVDAELEYIKDTIQNSPSTLTPS